MADWPPKKNAAFTVTFPIYDNDGDLVSAAASLDSEVSIDGGTFADCTNEATEVATSSGIYTLALTSAEMNGDIIATITKTTTTDAKTAVNVMYTATRQLVDLAYPTTSGRSIDVAVGGEVGIDLDNAVGALGTAEFDAGFLDATLIATDAIGAAELATDAVAEIVDAVWDEDATGHQTQGTFGQAIGDPAADTDTIYGMLTDLEDGNTVLGVTINAGGITSASFAAGAIDASAIAADAIGASEIAADAIGSSELAATAVDEIVDQVWNEAMSGHQTNGSFGRALQALAPVHGAVNDAGPTATDFDSDGFTEATNDHFNGHVLMFITGALTGQARIISDYVGTGQNFTFNQAFTEAPATSDEFVILPPIGPLLEMLLQQATGEVDSNVELWQTVAPNALVGGRVDADVGAMQAGTITATVIANAAIDAATFAAGAIDDAAMATDAFDGMFQRDMDQVEVGAPVHSMATAILKAVSRVRDNAGTLEIYRTDAATVHASQTVTVDATLDPVDELSVAS